MRAGFHPLTGSELTDAAVFYESQAPGLGSEFLEEIERLVGLISSYPDLGRPQAGDVRTIPARRFPYTVVYQFTGDRPYVLAIAHQRRKPRYWARRIR